jgi:hypothetical protein
MRLMRFAIIGLLFATVLVQTSPSQAAGTYWQLDPLQRHTDASGHLNITVGNPFTIATTPQPPANWLFPSLYKMPDNSIQLVYHSGINGRYDNDVDGIKRLIVRSTDQGQTWSAASSPVQRYDVGGNVRNANGTTSVLAYDFYAFRKSGNTAVAQMSVSNDGGATFGPIQLATFSGPSNVAPYALSLPTPDPYASTSDQWSRNVQAFLWRNVVQLSDGTLLAGGSSRFQGSSTWGAFCYRSTDYGITWGSPSIIGYDPNAPGEGFCEPSMSLTSTGNVLAVMRTGSYAPMMQSLSTDGGVTWQTPTPNGSSGVDPQLLLMSNGLLACSSGRPGNRLMFSVDGTGANWTDRLNLYDDDGDVYESSGYTGLVEVEPNRLLMVYDRGGRAGAATVEGVFITVTHAPEPSMFALSVAAAAGLLCNAWRRRRVNAE